MNPENILKNYVLSQYTMEKLIVIKEKLKQDIIQADPLWQIVTRKKGVTDIDVEEALNESNNDCNDILSNTSDQFSSTQFYFTQLDKLCDKNIKQECVPKLDITEYLFEELECANGKLDLNQLENLTDAEFQEIVCDLQKKLTMLGTYNLCCSLNNMTLEQRVKYAETFYTHLLLPKIIALKEPSRLLLSALIESTQKFPDDIQKFIFIPLLNLDLTDTTIIDAIVNTFEPERRIVLITEYLSHVKELKSWHLSFLRTLINTKTDITTNDKLIQLLFEKTVDFAKDKNFGKLVLSLIKSNIKFSDEQKQSLWEIANTNQTLYKKPIQNGYRRCKIKI
ncbi:uncharacterized protein LOC105665748 isoform X1 [Bombus terrestris]|uniref:Uncharacterized protein LOC105665748 isoform X1 n=1 Tax=Bombus terrestris TaxID=30195 RepID=A0A9B2MKS6_BOMTE|nr:uncharacterized protein LOC105665748 isoform X1 [Bombus terrestris]